MLLSLTINIMYQYNILKFFTLLWHYRSTHFRQRVHSLKPSSPVNHHQRRPKDKHGQLDVPINANTIYHDNERAWYCYWGHFKTVNNYLLWIIKKANVECISVILFHHLVKMYNTAFNPWRETFNRLLNTYVTLKWSTAIHTCVITVVFITTPNT